MRTLLYCLLLFVIFKSNGYAQSKKSGEQLPTLAWMGIPEHETTLARFEELKASGITHNFTLYSSADAMEKALKLAEKTGIKMVIACPELRSEPEKTVRRFMNSPATAAYYLKDEPPRKDFPALGEWAKRIQAVDNKHFCYLNLLPNHADLRDMGTDNYLDYLSLFIKEVPLQVLSFDQYPVIGAGSSNIRESWYDNLELFAKESKNAGKPFWAFALTVAHGPYPIPTQAALRLQVYSNLAYGAQGIQYFTYQTVKDARWDFNNGPLTLDGKRTEVYDRMKLMNQEIKALSPVFLGARLLNVSHTGDTVPTGTFKLASALPKPFRILETVGLGAIVSHLKNGNDEYLVVVNRDMVKTMKLMVKCDDNVQRVLKDGTTVPANAYMDTVVVEPGDVQIFKWKQ